MIICIVDGAQSAASCGASLTLSGMSGSAPYSRRALTTATSPFCEAMLSAVMLLVDCRQAGGREGQYCVGWTCMLVIMSQHSQKQASTQKAWQKSTVAAAGLPVRPNIQPALIRCLEPNTEDIWADRQPTPTA